MLQSRRQGGRGNVKYHYMQLQFRSLADRPPLSMWQNVKENSTDGDGDHDGGEREREQEGQEETRKRKWNEGGTMIREKLPSPKRLQLLIPHPRERREDEEEEEGEEIEEEQLRREEVYYPRQSQQPRDDDIPPNTEDDKGMKLTLLLPPPPLPPSPYFMMTLPFFQSSSFTSSSSPAFPSNLSPFSSSSSNSALWRELLQDNGRTFLLNSLEGSSSGASFPSFGSFKSLGSSPPLPDVHSPALASAAGPFYFTSLYAIPPVTAITNNPNYNRDNHNNNHSRDSNPTRDNNHHNRDHTEKESNNNNLYNNNNNHNSTLVRPPRPTMGLEDRLLELKQERAQERQVYPTLSSLSEMTGANLNFDSLLRVLEIQAEETS